MAGRKNTPTKLKLLRGNPGRRPLNDREPQPAAEKPPCPAFLSVRAKREWRRISKELFALGLLTRVDRSALAAYCDSYAVWQEAVEGLAKTGLIIKTQQGNVIQSPLLGIVNRAKDQMHKFLTEFGMTPASRVRLTITAPEAGASRLQKFLSGGKDG